VSGLDTAMRQAHARGDARRLVGLCQRAATGRSEAFWLTQAWVYALETGDLRAEGLREGLRALGAE
jgi:hypothetical protein